MNLDWTQLIIQLGISGVTLWILRDYLTRTDTRIDERDKAFLKFVNEHNDKMTKLIVESTEAIRRSSDLICKASKILEKVGEKIINHHK